jgi:hypothetical protein
MPTTLVIMGTVLERPRRQRKFEQNAGRSVTVTGITMLDVFNSRNTTVRSASLERRIFRVLLGDLETRLYSKNVSDCTWIDLCYSILECLAVDRICSLFFMFGKSKCYSFQKSSHVAVARYVKRRSIAMIQENSASRSFLRTIQSPGPTSKQNKQTMV